MFFSLFPIRPKICLFPIKRTYLSEDLLFKKTLLSYNFQKRPPIFPQKNSGSFFFPNCSYHFREKIEDLFLLLPIFGVKKIFSGKTSFLIRRNRIFFVSD